MLKTGFQAAWTWESEEYFQCRIGQGAARAQPEGQAAPQEPGGRAEPGHQHTAEGQDQAQPGEVGWDPARDGRAGARGRGGHLWVGARLPGPWTGPVQQWRSLR